LISTTPSPTASPSRSPLRSPSPTSGSPSTKRRP
jgi:hypothetical protein